MSDSKPLAGRRILVTRQPEQSEILSRRLAELGAEVLHIPTISVVALPASTVLPRLSRLRSYDWLLLTSANAVEVLQRHSRTLGIPEKEWPPVCAIGPATADKVHSLGIEVAGQPTDARSEGIVELFQRLYGHSLGGRSFLLPRARVARTLLPDALTRAGAAVDVVALYENRVPESNRQALQQALREGLDLVTLTSSSTARNLVALAEPLPTRGLECAVIGPITAATARQLKLDVVAVAAEPTSEALAESVARHFSPPA